ncbi:hypothetical protein [Hymenobacter saemangeumensis]|uniref:hypothetical protein n=1 Tax=Hymenobacter saemangeumensis TaxID=1084522 RepID=UPI0031E6361F
MKKLLLAALLGLPAMCLAQEPRLGESVPMHGDDFVGVWKMKARCVEVGCENPSAAEPAEGSLSAQTWTISQVSEGVFTLVSENKSIGTLRNGYFNSSGNAIEFTGSANGTANSTNHIVIKRPVGGKMSATRLIGRPASRGVCMMRFTVTGSE